MPCSFTHGQQHPSPEDPRRPGADPDPVSAVPKTVPHPESTVPVAREAGITRRVPFAPTVFRQPCESYGHEVEFPFDAKLSALLDWLAGLVDSPQPTPDEEGQP
jgi:hypothetical protein